MLEQLQTKLEARLRQREQAIANVNALNGAIEELRELIAEVEKPSNEGEETQAK